MFNYYENLINPDYLSVTNVSGLTRLHWTYILLHYQVFVLCLPDVLPEKYYITNLTLLLIESPPQDGVLYFVNDDGRTTPQQVRLQHPDGRLMNDFRWHAVRVERERNTVSSMWISTGVSDTVWPVFRTIFYPFCNELNNLT